MPHTVLLRPVLEAIMRAYPGGAIVVYGRDCLYLTVGGRGLIEAGLTPEHMIGRGPVEVFGPLVGAQVRDQYERCLAGWDGTEQVMFDDRLYEVIQHPVRIGFGDIVAGITITVDITERRAQEVERELFQARYRAILEHFPGAIILMNADGDVDLIAGEALRPSGFEPDKLVGKPFTDVMSTHEGPGLQDRFDRALAGEDIVSDTAVGDRIFQTRWHRIADIQGGGPAVVKVAVDVTAQRRATAELEASLNHAGALLREVHHRVKNNLQVVHSLLSLMARRADSPEAQASLHEVRDRVFAMSAVHSLLYQSEDLAAVRLDVYFRRLIFELIKGLPDLGTVEVVLELSEMQASADVSLNLGLILTELVSNAAKHGISGGRGTLVGVRLVQNDDGVALTVWDDGPGATVEVLNSSDRGMGLWLVRTLAEPLGGQLHVDTERGIRWTITLDPVAVPA